jgi:hypothetical protein
MLRCLAIALAVLALSAVPAAGASAGAAETRQDAASTHAYLVAAYSALHAVVSKWSSVEAGIQQLDSSVRAECAGVGAGSPQSEEEQKLSYEVAGALWATSYHADATVIQRFLETVEPLAWSDPAVTRGAHAYARSLHAMVALPVPNVCADVRSWIAGGFKAAPADTRQFDRRVEAIEIKELPRKLLSPYLRPADNALLARVEHVAHKFEELEFVHGQDYWNALLEVLSLNQ